jgi:hypothetical protein
LRYVKPVGFGMAGDDYPGPGIIGRRERGMERWARVVPRIPQQDLSNSAAEDLSITGGSKIAGLETSATTGTTESDWRHSPRHRNPRGRRKPLDGVLDPDCGIDGPALSGHQGGHEHQCIDGRELPYALLNVSGCHERFS